MLTKSKNTAIQALFVRDIVSLCFRVLFCRACPLRRWRASSPKGRALGKEVSFSMKPTGAYWKTSRNAKASPTRGRWHGEAVTERARMLTKSKKHSDTSPVCQRHRIAVLSCFILPGLPSQALARQLSQRESPWQRGFVFDETDLRLLENVTECQSLPYLGRWHCEAMTERARMLTKSKKHSDTSPVCQRHRIAVFLCFILPGLPSQALARQLSQRGEPLAKRFRLR